MTTALTLRPLQVSDITDRYLSWFRDPEVGRWLTARNITRDEAVAYLEDGQKRGHQHMFAICQDGQHIGNLKIGPIQPRHGLSDLVTFIGERDYWGKGLARQAIRLGSDHAFKELGIRKLSGGISSGNVGSLKAYTAAGWEIEGRIRDYYLADGVTYDWVLVSCWPNTRARSKEENDGD